VRYLHLRRGELIPVAVHRQPLPIFPPLSFIASFFGRNFD
jgi:hypothetical protein